jgi:hypothetical protein
MFPFAANLIIALPGVLERHMAVTYELILLLCSLLLFCFHHRGTIFTLQ